MYLMDRCLKSLFHNWHMLNASQFQVRVTCSVVGFSSFQLTMGKLTRQIHFKSMNENYFSKIME